MTPEELDEALTARDTQAAPATQGRPQSVPAMGPNPFDYRALIAAQPGASPKPPPPRPLHRCVPANYAVGPEALKARCHARLLKTLERMDPTLRYGGLFVGPSGCGKSSAAAFAVQRWRAKAPPSMVLRERVFWLDALTATDAEKRYKLGSGDPALLVDAYTAEWLVLDDIGKTTSPTLVQLILARRYQSGLPTLATSGLSRDELTEHIGAATVRRIVEFDGRKGLVVDCHERPAP